MSPEESDSSAGDTAATMSRFDMKDFGEAASFLRKSELELLTAHTVPFDGKAPARTAAKLRRERRVVVLIGVNSPSDVCLIDKTKEQVARSLVSF